MSDTDRIQSSVRRARRAVDAAIAGVFATALLVSVATGLPLAALAAVVVASVALEYAASSVVTRGVLRTVAASDAPPATVESVVGDVSSDLGIDAPALVYDADGETGVSVLETGGRTSLVVSGPLVADLDPTALRGVVAHELAHAALGHLRRFPLREAAGHVVGVVAFWVVVLQGLAAGQAAVLGGLYLVAAVTRHTELSALVYVGASLGVVLVPMALDAYASRLEECAADDVAVAHTTAASYCSALYRLTAGDGETFGGVGGVTREGRRGVLDRITAVYPTTEERLARQGCDVTDIAARVEESPRADAGPAATD